MTTEKIVTAAFGRYDTVTVYGLYQYDYGAKLRIEGLQLPKAVEVQYSAHETGGTSEPRIGITDDGVTIAPIPDSLLENGGATQDYTIYAYIYLADKDAGQTIKKITMPVTARPRPEVWDTPEDADLFRDAIAAVNESADRAEKAAESIEGYVDTAKADIDEYVAGKESELRGEPGTTPHIGENGHWWIGDVDTGVVASAGIISECVVIANGVEMEESVEAAEFSFNAFEYRKVVIRIEAKAASADSQILVSCYVNNGSAKRDLIRIPLGAISKNNRTTYIEWNPVSTGNESIQTAHGGVATTNITSVYVAAFYSLDMSKMVISAVLGDAVIPAGTKIYIWGFR